MPISKMLTFVLVSWCELLTTSVASVAGALPALTIYTWSLGDWKGARPLLWTLALYYPTNHDHRRGNENAR